MTMDKCLAALLVLILTKIKKLTNHNRIKFCIIFNLTFFTFELKSQS